MSVMSWPLCVRNRGHTKTTRSRLVAMMRKGSGTGAPPARAALSRRRFMLGAAAAGVGSGSASAQEGRWWEAIPGFAIPGNRKREQDRRERERDGESEVLNDLRRSAVPWRSEQMLESMDRAISLYERLAARGGWRPVPAGRTLRPGDDDDRLPLIRRRLFITADFGAEGIPSWKLDGYTFDSDIEMAVRRFQDRHGLKVNGRADRPTIDAMNVPVHARLEQLRLNRRRIEDVSYGRGEDRHVLVNVPAFQLEAVEHHEVVLRHRVIVGKPNRQTPSIRATIRALNFFPYWRVPQSVATLDLIPRLRKEPEYLGNEMIRVFNGVNGPELDPMQIDWASADGTKLWFRQDPGPQNALGLVRIDMPNPEIVYMHDTPMKSLFSQSGRAFSAGCVRVQDVFKLVEWIARYEAGFEQPGRVDQVLASGQAFDVTLTRPVPVIFAYITAWAEQNGRVDFRPDIYGRDGAKDLVAGLHDPEAPPPPSAGLAP